MSSRIARSEREAITGSPTPSTQTRVRAPSPRPSSSVSGCSITIRAARTNLTEPSGTIRVSRRVLIAEILQRQPHAENARADELAGLEVALRPQDPVDADRGVRHAGPAPELARDQALRPL